MIKGFSLLIIFTEGSFIDIWQDSKYAFVLLHKFALRSLLFQLPMCYIKIMLYQEKIS